MARANAQTWAMSNAGDDESVVLNQLREAALSGRDPSIGLFEWSAEDGCDLDNPKAWCQANPGLGHTISVQAIRSALGTDPPNVFRTEVLCQRVDQLDGAIDLNAWRSGADPSGTLNGLRSRVALCLDVAPELDHVTLAAAAALDDGRVRTELVAAWTTTAAARAELPAWIATIKPRVTGWYPSGPCAALFADLKDKRGMQALKAAEVPAVCQGFAELVSAGRVLHNADPLMATQVSGAAKLHSGDGWRFARRGVDHVDAVYASAGATHLARTLPAKPRPMIVVARRAS